MPQTGRYPRDWIEFHGGRAHSVFAAADLDDATEVAQADNAADAREPIDGKLVAGAADAALTRADAHALPTCKASTPVLQLRRSTKPRRKRRKPRSPT
jgi:hypothetical protein